MSRRLPAFSLALSLLAATGTAPAADLKGLRLVDEGQGTRATVEVDSLSGYKLFTLSSPDRLVIDLADARVAPGLHLPGPNGLVAGVRTGSPAPGTLRLVFDLPGPVRTDSVLEREGTLARLTVTLAQSGKPLASLAPAPRTSPVASALPARTAPAAITTQPRAAAVAPETRPRTWAASEVHPPTMASVAIPLPEVSAPEPELALAPPQTELPAAPPVEPAAPLPRIEVPVERAPRGRSSAIAASRAAHIPAPAPAAPETPRAAKTLRDVVGSGHRKLVVAIDAGHGGKDPGAHGPSGVREKNVTLAVARELARQVNADPGMRAVLIRDGDSFVPLKQRYMKARAAQADLFISIHADASPNDSATGASVFVLSTRGASSQAARWLADQENAADLVGGVSLDEKDRNLAAVLLDLSQSATMRASDDIANAVLGSLKNVGKAHKQGIERANFVVLRSPDVPSMLVETGFITNPGEEQRLNDPNYRGRRAAAITSGVRKYFAEQAPPGTWYAARRGSVGAEAGGELVAASPE
jgi:N-acetylmuramoyl-L-alanine amidase